MLILRQHEQRTVPWKNGRGVTREALVLPNDANAEPFQVRVSVATVDEDGPFSRFPGVDRWIYALDGAGMTLCIDGADHPLLPGVLLAFSGDADTVGRLVDGPVRDLNLMVRRPHAASVALGPVRSLVADVPTVVYLLTGALAADGADALNAGDCAWLSPGERLDGDATALVARLPDLRSSMPVTQVDARS